MYGESQIFEITTDLGADRVPRLRKSYVVCHEGEDAADAVEMFEKNAYDRHPIKEVRVVGEGLFIPQERDCPLKNTHDIELGIKHSRPDYDIHYRGKLLLKKSENPDLYGEFMALRDEYDAVHTARCQAPRSKQAMIECVEVERAWANKRADIVAKLLKWKENKDWSTE